MAKRADVKRVTQSRRRPGAAPAPPPDLNIIAAGLLQDMAAIQSSERSRFGYKRAAKVLAAAKDGEIAVRFEAPRSGRAGGLNLYGARMGAFPVDPTLFLDLE